MNILAIDTSTDYLSIAVMKDGRIIGKFHRRCPMRHSSMLVPMIDELLKKAGLRVKDIGCFAVSIGPGSFTGLRIGVATVKALAYTLRKKIVAVPTLDVIAQNAAGFHGVICPVLDARKNKVYACLYRSDGNKIKRISKYLLLSAADLKRRLVTYGNILLLGDAISFPKINSHPGGNAVSWQPRAEVVATLGSAEFKKKRFVKPQDLEPMYLYSKECDITGK